MASFVPRLVALPADHGVLAAVAADRSRIGPVVAEALRVTVPSPVMLRRAAVPSWIGDTAVREGERVVRRRVLIPAYRELVVSGAAPALTGITAGWLSSGPIGAKPPRCDGWPPRTLCTAARTRLGLDPTATSFAGAAHW